MSIQKVPKDTAYYKVLISIGDWTLQKSLTSNLYDHIGICHSSCPSSWMWWTAKELGTCIDCNKKIPEEVLGAWILLIFDRYTDI